MASVSAQQWRSPSSPPLAGSMQFVPPSVTCVEVVVMSVLNNQLASYLLRRHGLDEWGMPIVCVAVCFLSLGTFS